MIDFTVVHPLIQYLLISTCVCFSSYMVIAIGKFFCVEWAEEIWDEFTNDSAGTEIAAFSVLSSFFVICGFVLSWHFKFEFGVFMASFFLFFIALWNHILVAVVLFHPEGLITSVFKSWHTKIRNKKKGL